LRLLASALVVAAVASITAPASAGPTRAERRKGLKLGADAGSPTRESEAAVDGALEWLVRHQGADGHWDGVSMRKVGMAKVDSPGVTGLALLALLAAGNSEVSGAYSDNVRRGVKWLISKQEPGGAIGRGYEGNLGYHHGIAGLALAEACGMSPKVRRTRLAAQGAVDYSVRVHQSPKGGWRYNPGQTADVSVTGWFVQQLCAATKAGLKVDGRALRGAAAFVDTCAKPDGKVSYQPARSPTPCMTAVGMHCWQLTGRKRTDRRLTRAAGFLAENLPEWQGGGVNFYYWYHGTLAMYHHGGGHWLAWGRAIRETLVKRQRTGKPAIDGSWDPIGSWCGQGGRVYATAMAALCLEVSYRHSKGSR
jgi:hypothetical protein